MDNPETINVRENRRVNEEWTIQGIWQQCVHKAQDEDEYNIKKTHNTICVGHHYTQTNTNKT